ncbi:MAG: hypothetical protein WCO51_03810 [bacterium]|jgi:outer membrane lipoprotein-sorting protein
MIRVWIIALVLLFIAQDAQALDVSKMLQQAKAKAESAKTMKGQLVLTTKGTVQGKEVVKELLIDFTYKAPNKIYLTMRGSNALSGKTEMKMASNGDILYVYDASQNTYKKDKATKKFNPILDTGGTRGAISTPGSVYKLKRTFVLEGIPVYEILAEVPRKNLPSQAKVQTLIYVRQKDQMICGMSSDLLIPANAKGKVSNLRTTLMVKTLKINMPVDEKLFKWIPPAKATQASSKSNIPGKNTSQPK